MSESQRSKRSHLKSTNRQRLYDLNAREADRDLSDVLQCIGNSVEEHIGPAPDSDSLNYGDESEDVS